MKLTPETESLIGLLEDEHQLDHSGLSTLLGGEVLVAVMDGRDPVRWLFSFGSVDDDQIPSIYTGIIPNVSGWCSFSRASSLNRNSQINLNSASSQAAFFLSFHHELTPFLIHL